MRLGRALLIAVAALGIAAPGVASARTVPPVDGSDAPNAGTARTTPVLLLPGATWEVGQEMIVRGTGWPRGSISVQVCGNAAVNGTSDCDMPNSRVVGLGESGELGVKVTVGEPPEPCPCVVFARSIANGQSAVTPIAIKGHPMRDGAPIKSPEAGGTTLSLSMGLKGDRSWRDYFGTGPDRHVAVTLTNTGQLPTGAGRLDIALGKDFPPTGYGTIVSFESIGPGETRVVDATLQLDTFAYGDYWVGVEVKAPRVEATSAQRTSSFPSGLLASVVGLVLVGDLAWVLKVRRRKRAYIDELIEAQKPKPEPLPPPPLVDLRLTDAIEHDERFAAWLAANGAAPALVEAVRSGKHRDGSSTEAVDVWASFDAQVAAPATVAAAAAVAPPPPPPAAVATAVPPPPPAPVPPPPAVAPVIAPGPDGADSQIQWMALPSEPAGYVRQEWTTLDPDDLDD